MTWIDVADGSDFPLANLPYGVGIPNSPPGHHTRPRPLVAIGDTVVCLATVAEAGLLDGTGPDPFADFTSPTLNAFMARGPEVWSKVRIRLTELLTDESSRDRMQESLIGADDVTLRLPWAVGDYVDFYSSRHHAENLGRIFRPDAEALMPNWLHMPIGYHGRAGTVVVSGTEIRRPCGQRKPPTEAAPSYGPSVRLDIEAEVGFVIGTPTALGERVSTGEAADHIFGVVLVNDWSARDIQAWEYQPLGPFLGKSFATSVSPWVVPLAALEDARVPAETGADDPEVLDYLKPSAPWGFDLAMEVEWNGTVVSRPPFKTMHWTMDQQLAHATVNGASIRTGDLFASGTVSGPAPEQRGSFIELSWNGRDPVEVAGGTRTFLQDGDEVIIRATAPAVGGGTLGFGSVSGRILPAS